MEKESKKIRDKERRKEDDITVQDETVTKDREEESKGVGYEIIITKNEF